MGQNEVGGMKSEVQNLIEKSISESSNERLFVFFLISVNRKKKPRLWRGYLSTVE